MVVFPNAKINIGLHITEKRPDGFHNIESCFYPVGWADALEIRPSESLSFQSSGLPIPGATTPGATTPETALNNLCVKAYHLLARDYSLPPVDIHLLKAIPIGAGLGGGSADAAFTIRALNGLFDLKLTIAQQQDYARTLGSDCAFFIENQPKYCYGKGDQFEDIDLRLTGKWIVLVNPGLHISTAEAYAGVKPAQPATDLRQLLQQPISEWRTTVVNDFEASLFPIYPELPHLKDQLYELGALYASMSGSGSTVYGIFGNEPQFSNNFSSYSVWQGELS
ncbi:4-(cytidine 5'-diphospho)-2-C-methyl-D-erythritol kinase [Telluribacter humicola]|uniref:4-(cytidine 5'-diphospho)-2-C-methyl-D-erythritol kinase n=1 Tax=Telluribacter humicola TaxID=1720261 RepID=UPI001A95E136|nr:4-(cytidine 5'-diphospho)-2-C-methyl-D-erythritol kinase [Telluribacter humicola]